MGIVRLRDRSANNHIDLYNFAVASIYESGARIPEQDYALAKDAEIEDKIMRDIDVYQAMQIRSGKAVGTDSRIVPGDDQEISARAAQIMKKLLGPLEMNDFDEQQQELMTAIFFARAYAYIEGTRMWMNVDADGPMLNWWIPTGLRDIPRSRFAWFPINSVNAETGERQFDTELRLFSYTRREWMPIQHPEHFVKLIYGNSERRLGSGFGLLEVIFFHYWAKQIIWEEGLNGFERWANGWIIGKVDEERSGSTGKTNEDIRDQFQDELEKHRSRHTFVHGKLDEVQVVEGGGQGHQMMMDLLKHMQESIIRVILGAILPTGLAEGQGSQSRAETEADSTESLVQGDRRKKDQALTRDLIRLIWRLNQANFAKMGLAGAAMPKFETIHQKIYDPVINSQVVATLHSAGYPMKLDEISERTGFSVVTDEDRANKNVLEPAKEPQAFPFGNLTNVRNP